MLKKAVFVALFAAVPVFLGYPAALNIDPKDKKAAPVEKGGLESSALPAATVVSVQPRWLSIQGSMPGDKAQDGEVLTKEVQRQLRGQGCYGGEINGAWTQSTQQAMQTFINRINATLPVDQPNHVLLALLQNHPDKTCDKPCSLGEDPVADGRCVPGTIASLSVKIQSQRPSRILSWTAVETAAFEDDIPKLQPSKPPRSPVKAAPTTPPPAPRFVATAKPDREAPRHVQRSARDYARVSQRAERQASAPVHQNAFIRSVFQRAFDSSLR